MPAVTRTFIAPTIGRSLDRPVAASGLVRVLAMGTIVAVPLIALSLVNAGGFRVAWDNLHWSLTAVAASIATAWSIRGTTGRIHTVRAAGAVAFALWLGANLTWAWLNVIGQTTVPSVADRLHRARGCRVHCPVGRPLRRCRKRRTCPARMHAGDRGRRPPRGRGARGRCWDTHRDHRRRNRYGRDDGVSRL
jgi:hypothetical protein